MARADKVRIRKPDGYDIVGILESPDAVASSGATGRRQPIVLILHGLLAHKDQIYHKRLVKELLDEGLPSFRYDLTGQGGETDGKFQLSNFYDDADDLALVMDWLQSKGPHPHVPLYASVSGRWDLTRIARDSSYMKSLGTKDEYDWDVRVAGKTLTKRITRKDIKGFAEFDNSFLVSSFPQDVHVLNVHGIEDRIVPHTDADKLQTVLSNRSPGTSEIVKVEGAGHNWQKPFDEPVNSIMSWFRKHRNEAEKAVLRDQRPAKL